MTTRKILRALALLGLALPLAAEERSLATTYASGNGQDGCMFDVTARRSLRITGLETHFDSGAATVAVYGLPGGIDSARGNPAAWTLLGTARIEGGGDVTAGGVPTPLPIDFDLRVLAGETYGLYVTNHGGADASINYTDGSELGAVCAANGELQVHEGIGLEYPFAKPRGPRVWNGRISYELAELLPRGPRSAFAGGRDQAVPAVAAGPRFFVLDAGSGRTGEITSVEARHLLRAAREARIVGGAGRERTLVLLTATTRERAAVRSAWTPERVELLRLP